MSIKIATKCDKQYLDRTFTVVPGSTNFDISFTFQFGVNLYLC